MPLALSDSELQIVMSAAKPLQAKDRAEFLQTVASELQRYKLMGVGVVSRVVAKAQRKYFAAPSPHGIRSKWNR